MALTATAHLVRSQVSGARVSVGHTAWLTAAGARRAVQPPPLKAAHNARLSGPSALLEMGFRKAVGRVKLRR